MARRTLIALAFLAFLPAWSSAEEKGLLYFGVGAAEATYLETYFKLDEEIDGEVYNYSEVRYEKVKNLRATIPSSSGWTKGWFVDYVIFDQTLDDPFFGFEHRFALHEVSSNWSRGYAYEVHFGDKLSWLTTVEALLGVGFITFEKEINSGEKFDYKWGFDLIYGYAMNSVFWFDEGLYAGWRSQVLNNRITLEYGDEDGYLTHRRNIMLIVGGTFSGRAATCVPTAYVQC